MPTAVTTKAPPSSDEALTWEAAEQAVKTFERLFGQGDVAAIVELFAENCTIRFASVAEFRGRDALRAFLEARFARQQGYALRKTLRAVTSDTIIGQWEATWTDAATGTDMVGRGSEFCQMSGGLVDVWEAYFNVWEGGKPPSIEAFLGDD